MSRNGTTAGEFDYVVVGSGAGGGPLAGNLAKAGMQVLLIEAGTDAENYHYQVPCFHGLATEDEEYRWDFFVRHYADEEQQELDTKYVRERAGILYPRAGTLGGCTGHNAMITVYPHNQDWDYIASITGDPSWRSERMRQYFERLERCRYGHRPWGYPRNAVLAAILRRIPLVSRLLGNSGRHGYHGWLTTTLADPMLAIRDEELLDVILSAARKELADTLGRPLSLLEDLLIGNPLAFLDPNDWRVQSTSGVGLWLTPLAVNGRKRNGTREYIKEVERQFPDNLVVRTGCLASRVLFEGTRAIGVEYIDGCHAYRADPRASLAPNGHPVRQVFVRREVVLAGGAFNTPQLLKLSGIGPRDELSRFGIETRVDLPGVGENLQDRYEVGVVTEMTREFGLLKDCTFEAPAAGAAADPCFEQWVEGKGVYCTNGAVLGVVKKSSPSKSVPDLFLFGLPASFKGYFPGYSTQLERRKNFFTWAILKAHTRNSAGSVVLRSADPRDVPDINFHYFEEGNDASGDDLDAVVEGVRFARRLMARASRFVRQEVVPGDHVATPEQIREFVRNEAWGHHASCTCMMGSRSDPMAVVDSRFRVHGTEALRVVDASVFPRIPGFFIVTAVYMLSEKATDVILADVPMASRAVGLVARVAPKRLAMLVASRRGKTSPPVGAHLDAARTKGGTR